MKHAEDGRRRVVIERIWPEVDAGQFPIKRVPGEGVVVEADVFADGHDSLGCVLLYKKEDEPIWAETPMTPLANDRWRGEFRVEATGRYLYTVEGWIEISRFGEVPVTIVGHRFSVEPQGIHRAREPDSSRKSRASRILQSAFPRSGEHGIDLL